MILAILIRVMKHGSAIAAVQKGRSNEAFLWVNDLTIQYEWYGVMQPSA